MDPDGTATGVVGHGDGSPFDVDSDTGEAVFTTALGGIAAGEHQSGVATFSSLSQRKD